MDFNQSPYFDDFDEDKQFYRVLFKPGVAVQTREMNQLQSILQNQITKFGNHVFKDGSMVIPGQVNYNDRANYVKIAATNLGSNDLSWLEGKTLTTSATGSDGAVEATVFKAIPVTDTDPITLIVLYKSANQDAFGNDETLFLANATLYVKESLTATVTVQGGEGVTGRSVVAAQQAGVYYLGGYFVSVPTTEIVVEKYVTSLYNVNAKVGIAYTEQLLTASDDASLLDNASGTANAAAPGADRYKIATTFTSLALTATLENFFELIRVEEGQLQKIINGSQYNVLEDTLARRTFDESGNYIVNDFSFEVRESRSNNRGAWNINTRYEVGDYVSALSGATTRYFVCIQAGVSNSGTQPGEFTIVDETTSVQDGSVRWRFEDTPTDNRGVYDIGTSTTTVGSSANLVLAFGPGKAYIEGYEIQRASNAKISIAKARETQSVNNRDISLPIGNYAYFDSTQMRGLPDISKGPIAYFYDRTIPTTATTEFIGYGNKVGQGRIMYVDQDNTGGYKVGFTDVKMESGKSFDRDVNSLIVPDPAGSTAIRNVALSGNIKYVGPAAMDGTTTQTSSYVQLSGAVAFVPNVSYSDSSLSDVTGKGSRLSAPWRSFNNVYYNASTGSTAFAVASSSMQVFGFASAFSEELLVGDRLLVQSSSNLTSSWTVVSVADDTTMTITGGTFFNRYTTTGWSSFVASSINRTIPGWNSANLYGGQLLNATGTAYMSSLTIASAGDVGTLATLWLITGGPGAAFSSQLAIGSIVTFCDASGQTTHTGSFFNETSVPDSGYTYTQAITRNAVPFNDFGATNASGNANSSFMVVGYGNGSQLLLAGPRAAMFNAGRVPGVTLAPSSGLLVLLRGTNIQQVPTSWSTSNLVLPVSNGTSMHVGLAAGTVFGIGTGTTTRFQSEIGRLGDIYLGSTTNKAKITRIISENRMTIAFGSSIAGVAYSSLSINNAGTSTVVGSGFGIPYSGTLASFAANTYDNFALGINTRKMNGTYQLLDYTGGTGTATAFSAVQIRGDSAAKMSVELRANDLVRIGGFRIFITKVSSNTQAFGVCVDTSITGSATPQSMIRIGNQIADSNFNNLVYKVTDSLAGMVDNSYYVYKTVTVAGLSAGAQTVSVPLSGSPGTNLNTEAIATTDPSYFLVAENTVGTLGVPIRVATVTQINDTTIQLILTAPVASASVRVIFPVRRTVNDGTLQGGYRTKTLNFDTTEEFLTSSVAAKNQIRLGNADILRVNKILMANSFVTTWTDGTQSTAVDVTKNYILNNGQTDNYYGLGGLILRPGHPTATGSIKVYYDYFTHGAGDYFSLKSYEPFTQIPYDQIPFWNGTSLGDCIDFRSKINAATNTFDSLSVPRYGTSFSADLTYYLGRKEAIGLDRNGSFFTITSASALQPKDPDFKQDAKSLPLYFISLSPYTRGPNSPAVAVKKQTHKRYTMKDIGDLDRRVGALEEISSLSLLETKTKSLQIRDNNDPTLERYKTGFFVDNFTDNSNADPFFNRAFAIDTASQTLYPRTEYFTHPVIEKINYAGAILSTLEEAPQAAARAIDNYRITGDLLTLNYTTSTMFTQDIATTSISCAPFLKAEWIGGMTLTPDSDIYESIQSEQSTTIPGIDDVEQNNLASAQRALDSANARGQRNVRIVSFNQQRVLNRSVTKTAAPFCRANTILMVATGLKANTKFYPFFDDIPINPYVIGATKIDFLNMPTLQFGNNRADSGAWAKWRTKYESRWVEETIQISGPAAAIREGADMGPGRVSLGTYSTSYRRGGKGKGGGSVITNYFQRYKERRTFYPTSAAYQVRMPDASKGDIYAKALAGGASMYYYASGAYLGSAVAVYQNGTTLYCVNQRGQLSPAFLRSQAKTNGQSTFTYGGTFYVGVDQNDAKTPSNRTIFESAIMDDGNGNLISDANGVVVALFDLPDTDNIKFISGEKPIVLTTSATNDPEIWDARAEATYTAKGLNVDILTTNVSTKTFGLQTIPRGDPLAQSFKIPDQFTNGVFLSDIDVFFQDKTTDNIAVELELRECDTSGRPSGVAIPGSLVVLFPGQVAVDKTKGILPTKFTFNQPVHLLPEKNYALVLRSESTRYRAWVATLGQNDVAVPTKTYSTQATLGSLFKSQDGTLWSEDQLSDLKFILNRCVFSTNIATARVVNAVMNSGALPVNPFTAVHGSNKIRVRHPNHGLAPGDVVRFYSAYWADQYAANAAATLGGIPAGELFGTSLDADIVRDSDYKLTVSANDTITIDSYVVQVTTPANLGVGFTTGLSTQAIGGSDVFGSNNFLYHAVTPAAKVLSFASTALSFEAEMTSGFTYDNTYPSTSGTPYARTTEALTFNTTNFLNDPKILLSKPNEYFRADAAQQVGGGTSPTNWKDSFVGTFTLLTDDAAVSPAIDLSTFNIELLQYRIDYPTRTSRLPVTLPAVGTAFTGSTQMVDYEPVAIGDTTIEIDGITESLITTTPDLFKDIIPGNYITIDGGITANNYTSTGIRVIDVSNDGNILYVDGNLTTQAAGSSITIYQVKDHINEVTILGSDASSKYVNRRINLENPATSMKLLMDINLPGAADIEIYYKLGATNSNLLGQIWRKFTLPVPITKNDNRDEFSEIEINITDVDSAGNPIDFPEFTAFQLKIVMLTTNGAQIPRFRNMRVIAHA